MPNWVFNNLSVTGDIADLEQFKYEIAAPYTTYHQDLVSENGEWAKNEDGSYKRETNEKVHESVFSFWNAISPTDLDAYFGVKPPRKVSPDETMAETMAEIQRGFDEDNDWYNWNVRNWGTKWDACNAAVWEEPNELRYDFDTAWAIPEPALIAMSAKYPSLVFDLHSEEEQGWGADIIFSKGCAKLIKEWDVPNSHQDYIDQERECWGCESVWKQEDGTWDTSSLYDDCPPFDEEEANIAHAKAVEFFKANPMGKFYISTNLTDALASDTIANGGDAIV